MDHCNKALKEQIEILWQHQAQGSDLNYRFIRDHALAVMQLSEQILTGGPHSRSAESKVRSYAF
jgi:hypothetical protein